MTRFPEWPELLAEFVDRHRHQPFEWASNDCVLFASGWVQEATGEDPLGELRGAWTDMASAVRLLRDLGGLQAAITSKLGEPIPVGLAQRGDLALIEREDERGVGIVIGADVAVLSESGVAFVKLNEAAAAWRV
jgi:hypothetical protein